MFYYKVQTIVVSGYKSRSWLQTNSRLWLNQYGILGFLIGPKKNRIRIRNMEDNKQYRYILLDH